MKISPTLRERFEANVARNPGGCDEWTGCLTNGGYGQISIAAGTSRGAHVVAWFLATGEWPTAILHSCDNRRCVTVAHMTNGTKGLNNKDTAAKRKYHYGSAHHNGKLPDGAPDEIRRRRAAGETLRSLAMEFNISEAWVSQVCLGRARRIK